MHKSGSKDRKNGMQPARSAEVCEDMFNDEYSEGSLKIGERGKERRTVDPMSRVLSLMSSYRLKF